jgi:hypothetical protein
MWLLVLRIAVAVGGFVLTIIGWSAKSKETMILGVAMVGWAIPWVREVELDTAVKKAVADMEKGDEQQAKKRLRRVSQAPSFHKNGEEK